MDFPVRTKYGLILKIECAGIDHLNFNRSFDTV